MVSGERSKVANVKNLGMGNSSPLTLVFSKSAISLAGIKNRGETTACTHLRAMLSIVYRNCWEG